MTRINKNCSLITLSINGLNFSIERHGLKHCIRKHNLPLGCIQYMHFTINLRVKQMDPNKQIQVANMSSYFNT